MRQKSVPAKEPATADVGLRSPRHPWDDLFLELTHSRSKPVSAVHIARSRALLGFR
jgi:hypothetical protein